MNDYHMKICDSPVRITRRSHVFKGRVGIMSTTVVTGSDQLVRPS